MSKSAKMLRPWSAVLWVSVLLVLAGSRVVASVYYYEVTGTFPSNTTTTAYWAPNRAFEYRFSLEPEILNYMGVHDRIYLPADISYFLSGQKSAEISGLVRFSLEPLDTEGGAYRLLFPAVGTSEFPPSFNGWFHGRIYSETVLSAGPVEVVPTLYTGIFYATKQTEDQNDPFFFGAMVGGWHISDAVLRVSLTPEGLLSVPEASSLIAMALGGIPALCLWAFRRRYRRA